MRTVIGTALVVALTACGGSGGSTPSVNISNSPVTINVGPPDYIGAIGVTMTVQPNGSATLTYETAPPQVHTMTLPSILVSKLYFDLAAAMPLSSLPEAPEGGADLAGSLVISVAGQTSPNILGDSGVAGTLATDVWNIEGEFPARSP